MGQNIQTMDDVGDTYVYEDDLGEGAFGKVYKVRHKGTNSIYALKVIKCGSNEDLENVVGEMKALSKLDHPNIIKLIETKCVQKEMFTAEVSLICEYCPGGNLSHRLRSLNNKNINLKWMRQMADAIAYIHSMNVVHRDLKPDNIMLSLSNDIKVGDFGLSRDFVAMKREDETWESYYMENGCGTLFYLAPEVFNDHYTEKADVFALGILFYAIEERGSLEVNGMKHYGVFVRQANGNEVPLGVQMYMDKNGVNIPFNKTSQYLARVIGSALLFDQNRRPTAAKIKQQLNDYRRV